MQKENEIKVLLMIAREFNNNKITWSLGASMFLYFKKIATNFHDIDLLVANEDEEKVTKIMEKLEAKLMPRNPNKKYLTKSFLEYSLCGVDVDIMIGFAILNDGKVYDCSLNKDQIVEFYNLEGIKIPFQSLDLWLKYYELMGRVDKVKMIKNAKIN